MSTEIDVQDAVRAAAADVGRAWPLHSFVTANPLAGFEDRPFHEAVREGERRFGADGYPAAAVLRRAWRDGRIDSDCLARELEDAGYDRDPEALLDELEATDRDADASRTSAADARVDRAFAKWLAAFLDEGKAHWPMPNRERGFYEAVRAVARHDSQIPDADRLAALPDDPVDAIRSLLADHHEDRWPDAFRHHLAALPGWAALVNNRVRDGSDWQAEHPISLTGYVAVRLALADCFDAPLVPDGDGDGCEASDDRPLADAWLRAWEATYRGDLVDAVADASADRDPDAGDRPAAQFVFCIDTRSEVIRRHVEAAGDYETHGYAGFFGVPMRYQGYGETTTVDACPPIVDAAHYVADDPADDHATTRETHDRWTGVLDTGRDMIDALKTNAATAFSFVESTGAAYGAALAARTLGPGSVHGFLDAADDRVPDTHEFCDPALDAADGGDGDLPAGLTLEEKVEYAATAADLLGWETFARVVAFVGHASETANNPFDAALDCGACAGNPGGPSARVLAAICNEDAVRERLRDRGIDIPADTVFVAGEHNTTTDEVDLYDRHVPETHAEDLAAVREDLAAARESAAAERAGSDDPVETVDRRAGDWAETRPEWGLAGNAGFVVGPRDLTADLDLDGRAFLHSYDWRTDPDGDALAAIFSGPLVVGQWINSQYYFATVDPDVYGSGSKVTQNPVGNVGVYQGNGGDAETGLPLQSVRRDDDTPYHQPIRLEAVVHAPVDRVTDTLADVDAVRTLLDNDWLSLTVVDPTRDHTAFHYSGDLEWRPAVQSSDEPPVAQRATDD
ncbi:DUF2309 domain-containing protein [Halobacterium jilantaiense]|uniref:Probable inorganic carbon transporter subunit DabA n=1 Tax=Halobacterium jilantaiense TaxID=355548 RepID=A0A1I0P8K9_9EURY|nr:DUF2309 domain-containing protein [Halobacterium jilantaiense]SEW10687.1 hypothetical protein SAMN04487945_1490 [Halobacterium jilantaiense]